MRLDRDGNYRTPHVVDENRAPVDFTPGNPSASHYYSLGGESRTAAPTTAPPPQVDRTLRQADDDRATTRRSGRPPPRLTLLRRTVNVDSTDPFSVLALNHSAPRYADACPATTPPPTPYNDASSKPRRDPHDLSPSDLTAAPTCLLISRPPRHHHPRGGGAPRRKVGPISLRENRR